MFISAFCFTSIRKLGRRKSVKSKLDHTDSPKMNESAPRMNKSTTVGHGLIKKQEQTNMTRSASVLQRLQSEYGAVQVLPKKAQAPAPPTRVHNVRKSSVNSLISRKASNARMSVKSDLSENLTKTNQSTPRSRRSSIMCSTGHCSREPLPVSPEVIPRNLSSPEMPSDEFRETLTNVTPLNITTESHLKTPKKLNERRMSRKIDPIQYF